MKRLNVPQGSDNHFHEYFSTEKECESAGVFALKTCTCSIYYMEKKPINQVSIFES